MPRRDGLSAILVASLGAVLLAGCVTDSWARMQEEFAEVRVNCRLAGTILERDLHDRRLLRLIFRQRNAEELAASRDGRLACVQHWAAERGYRLTTI
ncbi:MAG TPA: hypothetical protein VJS15_10170, partial [Allosphingosinicella sp.]|nr:hypothetical protein [Allosphingosinicella sp.]